MARVRGVRRLSPARARAERTASAGTRVERWSDLAGLSAAAEDWSALSAAAARDPLGQDLGWLTAHAEAHAEPDEVFGLTVRDDAGPVAVVALRREPARGPLALRRALLVGDGTFDTDYLEPPVRPGAERAAVDALLDDLAARRGLEAAVLAGVPDDSPLLPALREALDRRGWRRREHPVPCCAAPLPDTFEAYVAGLKSRMRSKVRSALRRADEAGYALRWTRTEDELPRDLETLYALHAARWEERGEPGSFADPRRRDFYARLAPRLLRRGALRLALLERDGRAVAAQIGPVLGRTYYQLQEGFAPDLAGERVGTALRGLCLRTFIDDEGLEAYDFMAGVTRHKTEWGARPRPCTTVSFALPRWRARFTFAAKALVERVRGSGRSGE